MLKQLYKLANRLDKGGFVAAADEVDAIIKKAVDLTPEREREIEESWDRYFADPEKQEKNLIEQEYGLGVFSDDEDDFMGLESKPWHGFKWTYDGFPKNQAEHFKKFERYQTVISDDDNLPETIDDPAEGGTWVREVTFDKPEGVTKGNFQTVYRFIDTAKEQRRKELWGDDEVSPETQALIDSDDEESIDVAEEPAETVEAKESPKQHGGGTMLF